MQAAALEPGSRAGYLKPQVLNAGRWETNGISMGYGLIWDVFFKYINGWIMIDYV
jgi:hypothetical protein